MKHLDLIMPSPDPLSLLSAEDAEKNPRVQALMNEFKASLPKHFSRPRLIVSALKSFDHVLRADCSHEDCRVRASIHIRRPGGVGLLEFVETNEAGKPKVTYDRSDKPCTDCQSVIG